MASNRCEVVVKLGGDAEKVLEALEEMRRKVEAYCDRIRPLPMAQMQTTPTNCFRACVATVLGIPIDDVPVACDAETWEPEAWQDWLATLGMQCLEINLKAEQQIYMVRHDVLCIVSGKSPRDEKRLHAVVAQFCGDVGFRLLHDPHPDQIWIDGEPTMVSFFVPISGHPRVLKTQKV